MVSVGKQKLAEHMLFRAILILPCPSHLAVCTHKPVVIHQPKNVLLCYATRWASQSINI